MKIGVISDTHGIASNVERVISTMEHMDLLIHLGDHYDDGVFLGDRLDIKVVGVAGNCDQGADVNEEVVMTLMGHKFLLVHGHRYGVKENLMGLHYRALELGCDVALFGHTHIPLVVEHDEILLMNPGSLGLPKGGYKASYGVIEIDKENIHSQIVTL